MPAEHLHAVLHLTTALTGPLQRIETLLLTEQARIETWLRAEWRKTPAPLYTSVDLRNAGYQVRIGSLRSDLKAPEQIALPSGRYVRLETLIKRSQRVGVADYDASLVILNNDLISDIPEQLHDIEQHPAPPGLGWSSRLKSGHFKHFNAVATEFATLLGIDPWLINPLFRNCGELDFKKREGEDCLVRNVAALLESILKKYDEYGIDKPPCTIKADACTNGMSVSKVTLQEVSYTFETWGAQAAVADVPVVYIGDRFMVGGFYRVHGAWHQRKSACARHACRAAGLRRNLQYIRSYPRSRRRTEPFPCLRRARPLGVTGSGARTGRTQLRE